MPRRTASAPEHRRHRPGVLRHCGQSCGDVCHYPTPTSGPCPASRSRSASSRRITTMARSDRRQKLEPTLNSNGVRPSPGPSPGAASWSAECHTENSRAGLRADLAAAEDGRTPLPKPHPLLITPPGTSLRSIRYSIPARFVSFTASHEQFEHRESECRRPRGTLRFHPRHRREACRREDLSAHPHPLPAEPNGYLHIGHAKSICLNFGIAREFGGICNLAWTTPTRPRRMSNTWTPSPRTCAG